MVPIHYFHLYHLKVVVVVVGRPVRSILLRARHGVQYMLPHIDIQAVVQT